MASEQPLAAQPQADLIAVALRVWRQRAIRPSQLAALMPPGEAVAEKLFSDLARSIISPLRLDHRELEQALEGLPAPVAALLRQRLQAIGAWPTETTIARLLPLLFEWLDPEQEIDSGRLRRWRTLAEPFGDRVDSFLNAVMLQRESDDLIHPAEAVSLLTLHAAKGLEFAVVFIAGCEESMLPFSFGHDAADLEEERRLFYVGMTRARRRLYLTWARSRTLRGQKHQCSPSRFLADLPADQVQKMQPAGRRRRHQNQMKLF
jgi:superfamily I DNA/RNA helicase